MAIAEISIVPLGTRTPSLSEYVARAIKVLEQEKGAQTIGEMFRRLEEETGKLTYLERLWQYLTVFLKTVLNPPTQFCDP